MQYDYQKLYEKNAAFLEKRPLLFKGLLFLNTLLPYLFLLAYGGLWAYGAFWGEYTPKDFTKIFFVPALALLVVSVLRMAIDRPRPYSEEGAGIIPLKEKKGGKNSFPSRHLTCAAVIATLFLPFITWVSGILFLFTLILGYARFAFGWHYPSDLFAGFALGIFIGCGVFIL